MHYFKRMIGKRCFPFDRRQLAGIRALSLLAVFALLIFQAPWVQAETAAHRIEYTVTFHSGKADATVRMTVPDSQWLRVVTFDLDDRRLHSPHTEHGELEQKGGYLAWTLPGTDTTAVLEYQVKINEPRSSGHYSAWFDKDWVIMRADDLVPPFSARFRKGASAEAMLQFELPPGWSSVNTGYERDDGHRFFVASSRKVPRPTGWVIAGKGLSTRHDRLGETDISISGPPEQNVKPMETLAFLGLIWPQVREVFGDAEQKILVVSASDPMWRGGLSAGNSLYVHTDRPLVSENGTSTLVHELMHVLLGIHDARNHDWITEGLAEYYSIELLARAGAFTPERRQEILDGLERWSKDVKTLLTSNSQAETTARAALLFAALDKEIKQQTNNEKSLDDVVQALINNSGVSLDSLKDHSREVTGKPSKVLQSPLLEH